MRNLQNCQDEYLQMVKRLDASIEELNNTKDALQVAKNSAGIAEKDRRELEQYRRFGTVEEIKEVLDY